MSAVTDKEMEDAKKPTMASEMVTEARARAKSIPGLLAAPFSATQISWRPGATTKDKTKAMALAYIDSRDVQDRLDQVCGHWNWEVRYPWAEGKKLYCEIGLYLPNRGVVWKGDGAGDSAVEAEKGAFSDAFKRAAVKWGIGRYLYDLPAPWVEIDQYKRITDSAQQDLMNRYTKYMERLEERMDT